MVTVGIIGSGFGRYGLFPAFSATRGCRALAISGLDGQKLDAVAIAVPPDVQFEIAKAAIEKGLHVFAEKPLAPTCPQAQELLKLAEKHNIVHGIDFLFPDIDVWAKAKEILSGGALGKILHITVHWDFLSYDLQHKKLSWKTDATRGGGALSFYFSHTLYYLEHFVGKISDIRSLFSYTKERGNGGETGVDMLMTFENGARGVAHINCNAPGRHQHQVIFQCEKGAIMLVNEDGIVSNFTLTIYRENKKAHTFISNNKAHNGIDERVQVVKKLAARFINACNTHSQMNPSFADGVRVSELIEVVRANQLL